MLQHYGLAGVQRGLQRSRGGEDRVAGPAVLDHGLARDEEVEAVLGRERPVGAVHDLVVDDDADLAVLAGKLGRS